MTTSFRSAARRLPCRTRSASAHAIAALALLGALAAPACAQDAVSFRGRTVRMIVGSTPGGVTDLGARLIARFLGKHLPQSPTIVVQNMPGANGIAAANYFFHEVAPDGLTVLSGSSSQVTPDVIRTNPAVRYDPSKFALVGGVENAGTLLIAGKDAAARLGRREGPPVVMAQVGGARTAALIAVWGAEYLGWHVRWVTGYQGTPQVVYALMKSEADMMDTAGINFIEPLLKSGRFVPVLQTGVFTGGALRRRESFPDVPLFSELLAGKLPQEAASVFENWQRTVQIGKYYALPPGTPASYVQAYRDAFMQMQSDPDFPAQARAALDPDYVMMSGPETRRLIGELVATPAGDLDFINRLREKYGLAAGRKRER